MVIDQSVVTSIIYQYAQEPVETFANNTYEAEKMSAASVCRSEEERQAVIDVEDVKFTFSHNGSQFSLKEKQAEENHMIKLVDEGKPTPTTKGKGATRIGIDGSPEPAESYSEGYVLSEYGWNATHFKENTKTKLNTTLPDIISGVIPEAKPDITNKIIKPAILQELNLGGES